MSDSFRKIFALPHLFILLWIVSSCNNPFGDEGHVDSSPADVQSVTNQIDQDRFNPDLFHQRAILHLIAQNFDAAINDVKVAMNIDSLNAAYHFTLAEIHFAQREVVKSLVSLKAAVKIDPNHVESLVKLAELHFYTKKFKESIAYVKRVIDVDPHNSQAYYIHGMVFKHLGDTAKAVESLQTAVEYDPEHHDGYLQLGLIYYSIKDPLAEHYLNNALKLKPGNTDALYTLGMFYQSVDELDKANNTYYQILEIEPHFLNAHYNLGYILFDVKQEYENAIKHFNDVLKIDSTHSKSYYMRGLCNENLKKYEEARRDYQSSLNYETNFELAIKGLNRLDELSPQ